MLNELLGRVAYEAAAAATGCSQPWAEANKAKWIAAALAVDVATREACAKIADARAMRCEEKTARAEDADEVTELRSLAWQFSVLAAEMRKRPNAKVKGASDDQ